MWMTRVLAALAAAVLAAGCAGRGSTSAAGTGAPGKSSAGDITVFAASSLTEAFTELGDILERDRPGTRLTFNFASSSDLAVQIVEGAPADVFASADPIQMRVVQDAGLAEDPVDFATNRLVVITPADDPAGIEAARDVAEPGVELVVAAPEVPAGNYARRAFEKLGIADAAERNVVSNEADVKAVVTKVALGEADAGVAYVSDVTADVALEVRSLDFPQTADVVATYPITTLADAANDDGARLFFDLVTSRTGQRVLRKHGFGPA